MRKGMWVSNGDAVGIVASIDNDMAEVHFVDKDGRTTSSEIVDLDDLTQASFSDIPKARQPEPETARRFGYTIEIP